MHSAQTRLENFLPILTWLKKYSREDFNGDLFAGIITAILLIPQGIAYSMLAGLPPQLGLYASILPPIMYVLLGTSRTLSVGPVSIAAIMIASALSAPEISHLGNPVNSAIILAAEGGIIMLLMAALRMGGLVNFISHPVLTGFTSGASILIICSQIPQFIGLNKPQCGLDYSCYLDYIQAYSPVTIAIGMFSLSLLIFFGKPLCSILKRMGLASSIITGISKCGPLLAVIIATLLVFNLDLAASHSIKIVGNIPAGFPHLSFDFFNPEKWRLLLPYAGFIALIAYIESVAIAKVTANLRGQRINPNQELIALGTANIATALSGGMSVAGGFSRTMVNFSAGARTQMAMLVAVLILSIAVMFFTAWFEYIPKAALAAVIFIAIIPLVRLTDIIHTWRYDQSDGIAELVTLIGVLLMGIEEGLALGIIITIISYLRKTSRPHIAVVGRISGTEHYRNINRHKVQTWENLLLLRIDENITFANAGFIEDFIQSELSRQNNIQHIVLIFTSVSYIDATAFDALESLNSSLKANRLTLHFAEVKGPVMDKLQQTSLLEQLKPGKTFFCTADAVKELSPH
ncbi:MAG: sodium-independent anion transporter [Gammaproteobacteria bacterium]|nr:MAG: sodium-independent anion transporter [Gammaproteobacteria bacterium]